MAQALGYAAAAFIAKTLYEVGNALVTALN